MRWTNVRITTTGLSCLLLVTGTLALGFLTRNTDGALELQGSNLPDTVSPTGDRNNSCINVFGDMIWNWTNPVIEAPIGCTDLIQASPLATPVTKTVYTTLTLVSSCSTTSIVSTAFPITEVNYQPFTLAATDTEGGSIITYTPIPRVMPSPLSIMVPHGWTVASPGSTNNGVSSMRPTLIANANDTTTTAIASPTTTTDGNHSLVWITWAPTVAYSLPSFVTPKLPPPTRLSVDQNTPSPTPDPGVVDCVDSTCTEPPDCTSSDCTRGGDCTGPRCTYGGKCSGQRCTRGGTCVGHNCERGGECEGDNCVNGGSCTGSKCQRGGGCSGNNCSSGGGCVNTPLRKCSPGDCIGPLCGITLECPGCDKHITITVLPATGSTSRPTCVKDCPRLPRCAGDDTTCNVPCHAKGCSAQSMPTERPCTSLTTVNACTEIISSTVVQTFPVTSYSTTTQTRCDKTADCDARDLTVTSTMTTSREPDPVVNITGIYDYVDSYTYPATFFEAVESEYSESERTMGGTSASTSSINSTFTRSVSTDSTLTRSTFPSTETISLSTISTNIPSTNTTSSSPTATSGTFTNTSTISINTTSTTIPSTDITSDSTTATNTKTRPTAPKPTSASGCAQRPDGGSLCWSKCDPETGNAVRGGWKEGDPWCWLAHDESTAKCNTVKDCPSKIQCIPSSWVHGGCRGSELPSGDCTVLRGSHRQCWSKCDPATSELVRSPWKKGEPWCWLMSETINPFCTGSDCPTKIGCRGAGVYHGGCSSAP